MCQFASFFPLAARVPEKVSNIIQGGARLNGRSVVSLAPVCQFASLFSFPGCQSARESVEYYSGESQIERTFSGVLSASVPVCQFFFTWLPECQRKCRILFRGGQIERTFSSVLSASLPVFSPR